MARPLVVLTLAVLALVSLVCPARSRSDAEALALVRRYNQRHIGISGHERVRLLLKRNEVVSRTFELARFFVRGPDTISTVVTLLEPRSLAGLAYHIAEGAASESARVHLFVPAGSFAVLELKPSRFSEGLLGADFSYDDLRWTLPEGGWTYHHIGSRKVDGRPTHGVLGTTPAGEQSASSFRAIVQWFDDETGLILRREFYRAAGDFAGNAKPEKVFELTASRCIDGINRPVKMRMIGGDGNTSELILRAAEYGLGTVTWSALTTSGLPYIGQVAEAFPPSTVLAAGADWSGLELCNRQ